MTDVDELVGLPTALVSDCLNRFGAMRGAIRRLSGGYLCGPAFPVEVIAGESRTVHLAVERAPAGSVMVIDAQSHRDRAVWGDVLTLAATARKVAGLVVDGAVRDLDAMRQRDFPVFALGATPAGPHKGWSGKIGEPIACGGVLVRPGDVVVGDADGVVVVPAGEAARVSSLARERLELEESWTTRIADGEPSPDVLDLR